MTRLTEQELQALEKCSADVSDAYPMIAGMVLCIIRELCALRKVAEAAAKDHQGSRGSRCRLGVTMTPCAICNALAAWERGE